MKKKNKFKNWKIVLIAVAILLPVAGVLAINSLLEGWRAVKNATTELTETPEGCKRVVNSSGNDYFVPTKTSTEWSAFKNNLPENVSLAECCTPTTCGALGYNCGSHSDGCGGTLNCGTCSSSVSCGAWAPYCTSCKSGATYLNRRLCTASTCQGGNCAPSSYYEYGTVLDTCGSNEGCEVSLGGCYACECSGYGTQYIETLSCDKYHRSGTYEKWGLCNCCRYVSYDNRVEQCMDYNCLPGYYEDWSWGYESLYCSSCDNFIDNHQCTPGCGPSPICGSYLKRECTSVYFEECDAYYEIESFSCVSSCP